MSSGYTSCGCRDCMEIAIDGSCLECEDAGCDLDRGAECFVPPEPELVEGELDWQKKERDMKHRQALNSMAENGGAED